MNWDKIAEPNIRYTRESQKRTNFERDHDRIIFSSSFKRLNQKTQVFPMPKSYFVHNRMTHSIETSCIGRSLGKIAANFLIKDRDVKASVNFSENVGTIVETACLAHDIGNPPFGHSGEDAISNFFMKNKEIICKFSKKQQEDLLNFEGNAQGFRLLSKQNSDLDVTSNILIAFTKYPKESIVENYTNEELKKRKDQKKFGFFQNERKIFEEIAVHFELIKLSISDEIAYARHPLAYLVEAADDICYLILDLEDGVRLKLVHLEEMLNILNPMIKKYDNDKCFQSKYEGIPTIDGKAAYLRSKIINILIEEVIEIFKKNINEIENGYFSSTLMKKIEFKEEIYKLEEVSYEKLYRHRPVLEIEAAGFSVVSGLLDYIFQIRNDPSNKQNKKLKNLFPSCVTIEDSSYESILEVTDYISGMTDWYAIDLYNKIRGVTLPEIY